jgi:hypothetical protein
MSESTTLVRPAGGNPPLDIVSEPYFPLPQISDRRREVGAGGELVDPLWIAMTCASLPVGCGASPCATLPGRTARWVASPTTMRTIY